MTVDRPSMTLTRDDVEEIKLEMKQLSRQQLVAQTKIAMINSNASAKASTSSVHPIIRTLSPSPAQQHRESNNNDAAASNRAQSSSTSVPTASSSSSSSSSSADDNPFDYVSPTPTDTHGDEYDAVPTHRAVAISIPSSAAAAVAVNHDGFDAPSLCWRASTLSLIRLAIPAVLVNLLFVSMGTGSQMLVGHIDRDSLAASVVANMVFSVVWFFSFGFVGALDTLAAQSFGAGSMQGVRLWTKRAAIISSLLTIPTALPIFFSYDIIHTLLGQSEAIAYAAQEYCRWIVFGLWPFNMTVVLQKYLQAQGIMFPTIYIAIFANILNIILEYLLIWPAGLGLVGGAIGMAIARWAQFFVTLAYVYARDRRIEREEMQFKVAEGHRKNIELEKKLQQDEDEQEEKRMHASGLVGTSMPSTPTSAVTTIAISTDSDDIIASPSSNPIKFITRGSSRLLIAGGASLKKSASELALHISTLSRDAVEIAKDPIQAMRQLDAKRKEAMEGVWNKAAIKHFLMLGLSGGLMMGIESWSFEATGIFATRLSLLELDAHYVLINTIMITYFTMPFGVSIAASIRIGHLIGGGHVDAAKLTTKIAIAFGAGFMALSGMTMAIARNVIGAVFSNDADVIAQVARIAPIGGLFQVFDGIQGSAAGVLRGLGLQREAAIGNTFGLALCGVTSAYLLAFVANMGLPGLWWGLALGLTMTAIINVLILVRCDWYKQVDDAQRRTKLDEDEYAARREEIVREEEQKRMRQEEEERQTTIADIEEEEYNGTNERTIKDDAGMMQRPDGVPEL